MSKSSKKIKRLKKKNKLLKKDVKFWESLSESLIWIADHRRWERDTK